MHDLGVIMLRLESAVVFTRLKETVYNIDVGSVQKKEQQ